MKSDRSSPRYTIEYNDHLQKFDGSVSALCWAYNEELLIRNFLFRLNGMLKRTVLDYEIVVIDDCSKDQTNFIIRDIQRQIPQVRLFRNEKNMNVGFSCKRAIREATKDYLFWQTVDWSYNIRMLRIFLELLNHHDVVAGVRRVPVTIKNCYVQWIGGVFELFGMKHLKKRSDTIGKSLISVINYCLIRSLFNLPISDYQNVVFYPTKMIQSFTMEANSSFINPELLIKSYLNGANIIEVPISFLPRSVGEAKGTKTKAILKSVTDIFKLWVTWRLFGKISTQLNGGVTRLIPEDWEIV